MEVAEQSDQNLLDEHVAGTAGAFDELDRRHRRRLWRLALRILQDENDAADAVQEALLAALRGASSFRGEAKVGTWLYQITVNVCLRQMSRRDRLRDMTPFDDETVASPTARDPYATRDMTWDVETALQRLPPDQRVAVVLVDLEGLPIAVVSDVLGVPAGTVKSRCARARARLAILLGYLGPEHARPGGGRRHAGDGREGDDD